MQAWLKVGKSGSSSSMAGNIDCDFNGYDNKGNILYWRETWSDCMELNSGLLAGK